MFYPTAAFAVGHFLSSTAKVHRHPSFCTQKPRRFERMQCSSFLPPPELTTSSALQTRKSSSETNETFNEEPEADKRLRIFFLASPFKTANYAIEYFLQPSVEKRIPVLKKFEDQTEKLTTETTTDLCIGKGAELFEVFFNPHRPTKESGKKYVNEIDKKRASFKLSVAYKGTAFNGWQIQSQCVNKSSVQGVLVDLLDLHLNSEFRASKGKKIDIRVCGRTDAGVSAISQICRVRTATNVGSERIKSLINTSDWCKDGFLRCLLVEEVSSKFHPTFGARERAYAYFLDVDKELMTHHVPLIDAMLRKLEGKELDFLAFSYGKVETQTTLCTLLHARASLVFSGPEADSVAVCIELVGNRFLRRMVRKLVSTVVREALFSEECIEGSFDDESLLNLLKKRRRDLVAKAAPAQGLVFVGANFH